MVGLADKYPIQSVPDQEIRALQQDYLTNDFNIHFGPSKSSISVGGAECVGAVNLAHFADTPSMLLLALYQCCYLGGDPFTGFTRPDGTV